MKIRDIKVLRDSSSAEFVRNLTTTVREMQLIGLVVKIINPHLVIDPHGDFHFVATVTGSSKRADKKMEWKNIK